VIDCCKMLIWNKVYQPPIQCVPATLFPEIKRLEREADHWTPSTTEFKNVWSFTSTPPYVFRSRYLSTRIILPSHRSYWWKGDSGSIMIKQGVPTEYVEEFWNNNRSLRCLGSFIQVTGRIKCRGNYWSNWKMKTCETIAILCGHNVTRTTIKVR